MAKIKGGKHRGDSVDVDKLYTCPLCGAQGTKRQTREVRGGRFCKEHGEPHQILAAVAAVRRGRKKVV